MTKTSRRFRVSAAHNRGDAVATPSPLRSFSQPPSGISGSRLLKDDLVSSASGVPRDSTMEGFECLQLAGLHAGGSNILRNPIDRLVAVKEGLAFCSVFK